MVSGAGTGAFSANITELTIDQIYYVRAYATNSKGAVYGEEVSFILAATLPSVITQEVTNINIAAGTAIFNGTIVSIGDPAYTERGFVYGITHNPTIDDTKKLASGSGTGTFSSPIIGLSEGNTYYVRAYATNSKGTAYSTEIALDFNAIMPTVTTQTTTNINIGAGTATFNGTILTIGDPIYTERGFVYGTTHNPTVEDNTKKEASGTGTGAFSSQITGLSEGNTYYVRAYAVNSKGTAYGQEVSFGFNAVMPEVTTQAVSGIDATIAIFNGNIVSIGSPAYIERGFVYSTSINPSITNGIKTIVPGTTTGKYSTSITGLVNATTYHVRAYATNIKGTSYGEEVYFTAEMQPFIELSALGIAVSRTNITDSYQPISWTSANNLCANSTLGGYRDWRIPTIEELAGIYENKSKFENLHERTNYSVTDNNGITAYVYDFYWSSTSYSASTYKLFSFYNGVSPGYADKDKSYAAETVSGKNNLMGFYCRCVRTLP